MKIRSGSGVSRKILRNLGLSLAAGCLLLAAGCSSSRPEPVAVTVTDAARGRQFYDTTCIACHTTQAHWREKKIVRSWDQLVGVVTLWQRETGQVWSRQDIEDVAAYLNGQFYRLPCPKQGCSGAGSRG